MKKDCNIIKDLLPLYVDKVCSNETKKMVEKHLESCEDCRSYKESLKIDIKEFKTNEINIIKSFAKKINFKIIKSIILCLITISVGVFGVLMFCGRYEFTLDYSNEIDILLFGDTKKWGFNIYKPITGTLKAISIPYQENGKNINIIFLTNKYSLYDKWDSMKYKKIGMYLDIDYSSIDLNEKIEVYYTTDDLNDIRKSTLSELKKIINNSHLIFTNETKKSEIYCNLNNKEYNYILTYYDINKQVIDSEGDNTMPDEILHDKSSNSAIVERYPNEDNKVVWFFMDKVDDVFEKIEDYMKANGGACTITELK